MPVIRKTWPSKGFPRDSKPHWSDCGVSGCLARSRRPPLPDPQPSSRTGTPNLWRLPTKPCHATSSHHTPVNATSFLRGNGRSVPLSRGIGDSGPPQSAMIPRLLSTREQSPARSSKRPRRSGTAAGGRARAPVPAHQSGRRLGEGCKNRVSKARAPVDSPRAGCTSIPFPKTSIDQTAQISFA